MKEGRERDLALAWHLFDFGLALLGLAWSIYFWRERRRKPRLVETRPR